MTLRTSNFTTASPDAWFLFRQNGVLKTAVTNGKSFVVMLQDALRKSLELAQPVRSFDGTMVRGTDVTPDGNWGPGTYRALWAYLSRTGAPAVVLDAVAASARARQINVPMLTFAAKVILLSNGFVPDSVMVQNDAVAPRFATALSGPAVSLTVRDATTEESALAGPTQAPPQASAPSGTGVPPKIRPPVAPIPVVDAPVSSTAPVSPVVPQDTIALLPTGTVRTTVQSGLSFGPIAIAGFAVVLMGLLAWSLSDKDKKPDSPPKRTRR